MSDSNIRYFFIYFRSLISFSPWKFALGCFLTLCNTLCASIGLLLLIPLLHLAGLLNQSGMDDNTLWGRFLPSQHGQLSLFTALFLFFILMTLFASIEYVSMQVMDTLERRYLFHLQKEMNTAVANASWSYLLSQKLKNVESVLFYGFTQIGMMTHYSLQLVSTVIITSLYFTFSCLISWQLTLIAFIFGCVLFLISIKNRAATLGKKNFSTQKQLLEALSNFLQGVKLAKSYNGIPAYLLHFNQLNWQNMQSKRQFFSDQRHMTLRFRIFSTLIFSMLFYIAVRFLHVHIATLLALLIIFSRLVSRISMLQQLSLDVLNIAPVFTESQKMLLDFEWHADTKPLKNIVTLQNHIRLSHIHFSYSEKKVLFDVNCIFPVNKITAIVSRSGSGKSTLADLLLGLLQPTSGHIEIDDVILSEKNMASWRTLISYVPQEAFFFNDTIRMNLLWAAPDADDAMMWDALKLAAADHFVDALPDKLESSMGDRGNHFSGGERQRLALTRALLRNPTVLLLDEATSALDAYHEEMIYHTLKNLKKRMTIIVIAHHFNTKQADHIVPLDISYLGVGA